MKNDFQAASSDVEDGASIEFPQANIDAVRIIRSLFHTNLGPVSRDTLIAREETSENEEIRPSVQDVTISGDGATILEALDIEHPVGPLLERLVGPERPGETDVEGERIVDGITTRLVFLGELLDAASTLLETGLNPRSIIQGYAHAQMVAIEALTDIRRDLQDMNDPDAIERAAATTAMNGNDVGGIADFLARKAVESVDLVGTPTEVSFVVRTIKAGSISDSRLVRGAILDRSNRVDERMPHQVKDASILVIDGHDRGGLQDRESHVDITANLSPSDDSTEFDSMRRSRKRQLVEHFDDLGVDVIVTRLGIDAAYQDLLAERGIMGIRSVTNLDIRQLTAATGAHPVLDPSDVAVEDLGYAEQVTETMIEPYQSRRKRRRMVVFDGCSTPDSVAVLLRGVQGPLADQATTDLRKAARAVANARGLGGADSGLVPGGGGTHMAVSRSIRAAAKAVDRREQLALDAYADALEGLLATLARNGGLDPLTLVADLKAAQVDGQGTEGLILPEGTIRDAWSAGIVDTYTDVRDAYHASTVVANLILRIDDAIDAVHIEEPAGPADAIYDDPAERNQDWLSEQEQT